MELDIFKITFLAILQGITEFLPVSSSAHLILPKELFGWSDQGLVFDVAVHVGSLIAVVSYLRRDIAALFTGWIRSCAGRGTDTNGRLAWFIILATIPVAQYSRSMLLIGFTSIFFGVFLYYADRYQGVRQPMEKMSLMTAVIIGLAQLMALIPGTSRSGITLTAGLFCGLDRKAAAKFSFLLAIPIIIASGLFKGLEMIESGASGQWAILFYAIAVSAIVSFTCIHYFISLISRIGLVPFVIYRIMLGLGLFAIYFSRTA